MLSENRPQPAAQYRLAVRFVNHPSRQIPFQAMSHGPA